jgi:DNA-binding transcriptional ArsR family regulator
MVTGIRTVPGANELAQVAALLADGTRAAICMALLDGRAWTATELAHHTGVAASTASEHLTKLVAGGLLTQWRQGRHRYVSLAGPHVAELLEDIAGRLGRPTTQATSLRAASTSAALARARTCYDHLAGRLGVAVTEALWDLGVLEGFALTDKGRGWFATAFDETDLGTDGPGRRPVVRVCLDWTERRPHLAGVAGARICTRLFERRWITRIGTSRAVQVTPAGRRGLEELFTMDSDALHCGVAREGTAGSGPASVGEGDCEVNHVDVVRQAV